LVDSAYQDVLGRAPDGAGRAAWSAALDRGLAPSQFSWSLTHSAEYYQNIVTRAYQGYLGRTPDSAGLAAWVAALQGGLKDEQLEAGFIGSAEYIADHGGSGAAWVDGMYHDLLGRTPAATEVSGWVRAMAQGLTPEQVAYGFAASAEREGQRVSADYVHYLGRQPSTDEVDAWVQVFLHGASNEDVIAGFVGSPEYFQKHTGQGVGDPPPNAPPPSSMPANPVPYQPDTVFKLANYWIDVPASYDATHQTPTELFVWLHGCGGESAGDIYNVLPTGGRTYIVITVDGREGACWDVNADRAKVLAAIADVKTHFNIDPRRVVLGGYSSGGDLAYRVAFENSNLIAGVLAENTSPFRDTGLTPDQALQMVHFQFHVVHLAHTQDDTYPIDGVRGEIDTLRQAGFDVNLQELPGDHWDNDAGNTGTVHDMQTVLLPHLNDGWTSPGA
jgi:hypothetical protein